MIYKSLSQVEHALCTKRGHFEFSICDLYAFLFATYFSFLQNLLSTRDIRSRRSSHLKVPKKSSKFRLLIRLRFRCGKAMQFQENKTQKISLNESI